MKITRLNNGSWLITMDDVSFVVDPVFSSTSQWNQLSEAESKAHQAAFFLVTQGGKHHFDLRSYKYISLDRTIILPPDFISKASKLLKHQLRSAHESTPFEYKGLKITGYSTQNRIFDPFLLKKATSVYYIIESDTEKLVISGSVDHVSKISLKSDKRNTVAIIPFGLSNETSLLNDAQIPAHKSIDIFSYLETDFLIPFSDHKGNVVTNTILPLIRGQALESKFIFIEPGEIKEIG